MINFVDKDKLGRKMYKGFVSSKELAQADRFLQCLQDEIPKMASKIQEKYGTGVLYKYYLGKEMGILLDKYEISAVNRIDLWKEIKIFAADKERSRADGGNSKTRKFYEQCYELSKIDLSTVQKLSWRQWQDLLDRVVNREDKRIFLWIGQHESKIKESEWRSFEKALNLYLTDKDTSVFEDKELFEIYDNLLMMANIWISGFEIFAKDHPKSTKIKSKAKWEKKYYKSCLQRKRKKRINLDAVMSMVLLNEVLNN